LKDPGYELFTGNGGFYHCARLSNGPASDTFNEQLFMHQVGVPSGHLRYIARRDSGAPERITRFSFGPLGPDSYDGDMATLSKASTG